MDTEDAIKETETATGQTRPEGPASAQQQSQAGRGENDQAISSLYPTKTHLVPSIKNKKDPSLTTSP